MFQHKRMFKVISPIERKDGGKFWIRCGNAYVNKDNSINVYLDAMPLIPGKDGQGVTLQLRELSEEELRERAEKKAAYSARGTLGNFATAPAGMPGAVGAAGAASAAEDGVPF